MSILRVVQNNVEFYTVIKTGRSGMSEAGIARLCGVTRQSMNQRIQLIVSGKSVPECLKEFAGKDPSCQATLRINGMNVKINFFPSDFCAGLIEFYAFESKHKNQTALFSYRKFAKMGMEAWIQNITGWQPQKELTLESVSAFIEQHKTPGTIATEINTQAVIEMLQECNFTGAGYRLYFYLEMKGLREEKPDVKQICDDLKISRTTFRKWLPKVHEWSHCADWLELTTRQGVEYEIQKRLHAELGGKMEAYTPIGPVDLVTKTEVIEIKRIEDWKEALGQVIAKAAFFPKLAKRIHLFGTSSKILRKITTTCQPLDVTVTFEKALLAG